MTLQTTRGRWGPALLRIAFGAAGLGVLAVMVRRIGPSAILDVLGPAWRWLPVAAVLEAGRLLTETLATYYAYGVRARVIPRRMLVRAHLVAYAVSSVMPAGRAAGEATKVALLCRYAGIPAATAAAATNQAVTLIAGGLISVPCAAAAWQLTGPSVVTIALLVHAFVLCATGFGIRAAARSQGVGGKLSRALDRFAGDPSAFSRTSREVALLPRAPTAAMLLGRALQIAVFAVLAHAVGIDVSPARALYAQGINMISLAVGFLVPGQFGASDGAFALSADPLGTSVARAMSIALLAHVLQLAWVATGSLALLVWHTEPAPRTKAPSDPT